MPKIVTFHSFRRGTGKSSLAANSAALCALQGLRVGLVDLSLPSPSLTYTFQMENQAIPYRINDFIWGDCQMQQAAYDITEHLEQIWHTSIPGSLTLVPASTHQSDIARTIKGAYDYDSMDDGFMELIRAADLDVLILDTRAGINDDTVFALAVSDTLFIIMRPDQQDYQGTAVTVEVARRLEVPSIGLIANNVPNKIDAAALRHELQETYHCEVPAVIHFSTDMVSMEYPRVLALENPEHPIIKTLREMLSNHVNPSST